MDWRKITSYGSAIAMELCWLYVVLTLINRQAANGQLFLFGILLIHPLSFGFNKLILRLAWHTAYRNTISWLAWAVVTLVIVKLQLFSDVAWSNPDWIASLPLAIPQLIYTCKPELILLISSAILWWLGKWLAHRTVDFGTTIVEFQFGLIVLLITFAIASALEIIPADAIVVTLVFFFIALFGISIAHAHEEKSWLHGDNRLQWSWLLLLSIALVLILGLIVGAVISHDVLQLIVDALKWLYRLALKVITFIASLLPRQETTGTIPPGMAMPPQEPQETDVFFTIPEPFRSWFQVAMAALWIGLIAVALWRISSQIYQWLQRRFTTKGTETEPLRGAFLADLLGLLRRVLFHLSRLTVLPWLLLGKSGHLPQEAISVHQIYRHLLHWGAARGYSRQLWQTPNEYLCKLTTVVPALQEDLSFITRHYVNTRYGNSIPTTTELDELKQSWKRVKQSRLKNK